MQMVCVGLLAYDDEKNLILYPRCKELKSTHLIVSAFLGCNTSWNILEYRT